VLVIDDEPQILRALRTILSQNGYQVVSAGRGEDRDTWGEGVRLVVLESEHGLMLEPLLRCIVSLMELREEREAITIVVPQSIRPRWWSNLMRTQMATLLRLSLPLETGGRHH